LYHLIDRYRYIAAKRACPLSNPGSRFNRRQISHIYVKSGGPDQSDSIDYNRTRQRTAAWILNRPFCFLLFQRTNEFTYIRACTEVIERSEPERKTIRNDCRRAIFNCTVADFLLNVQLVYHFTFSIKINDII
jgi:hypothetical protein